jgi:putative hydrolase of the HAD superfamily
MIDDYPVVFFDAGGTLFHPYPSVGEIYAEVSARYGGRASGPDLEKIFRRTWIARDREGGAACGAQKGHHSNEKIEKQWWYALVRAVFDQAGGVSDFDSFFEELYDLFADPQVWRLYEGTAEVLGRLKKTGKRLAVVSNWDSRLFHRVEGLGLNGYFEFVLASAVVGCSKPGRRIFDEALRRMGTGADRAVHVGDSLEDDIRGAAGAGIAGILVDRHHPMHGGRREVPSGVKVIGHLDELLNGTASTEGE